MTEYLDYIDLNDIDKYILSETAETGNAQAIDNIINEYYENEEE